MNLLEVAGKRPANTRLGPVLRQLELLCVQGEVSDLQPGLLAHKRHTTIQTKTSWLS